MEQKPDQIVFLRQHEPREDAFDLLVPQGWLIEGGVVRANHMTQVVNAQTISAKVDFIVQSDPAGAKQVHFVPEVKYCDMRMNTAGMMGFFPPGSNYSGMVVCPFMPFQQFLAQVVFPYIHPQAQQARLLEQKPLPELLELYKQRRTAQGAMTNFMYEAGMVVFQYQENGVTYKEKGYAILENMGQIAAGAWNNPYTLTMRAPDETFDNWEPVLNEIARSFKINNAWLAQEWASQEMLSQAFLNAQQAEQMRAQRALEVQRYLQEADRQILEHRQRTFAEIRNDQYLTMTNQEEYVNPYTKQVDLGSNQWNFRWVNENNDAFYSNHAGDDPNQNPALSQTNWKRSEVRSRFPQ